MPTIFRLDVCWIANAKSAVTPKNTISGRRSEEHTSELQSRSDLVCRLLLEKKKNKFKRFSGAPHSNTERTQHNARPARSPPPDSGCVPTLQPVCFSPAVWTAADDRRLTHGH